MVGAGSRGEMTATKTLLRGNWEQAEINSSQIIGSLSKFNKHA